VERGTFSYLRSFYGEPLIFVYMIGAASLSVISMGCARVSYQPSPVEDTSVLHFTAWGNFFEKARGEPPLLPASTSPSLRCALFYSNALVPYLHALRASEPLGSHITPFMTLVARTC